MSSMIVPRITVGFLHVATLRKLRFEGMPPKPWNSPESEVFYDAVESMAASDDHAECPKPPEAQECPECCSAYFHDAVESLTSDEEKEEDEDDDESESGTSDESESDIDSRTSETSDMIFSHRDDLVGGADRPGVADLMAMCHDAESGRVFGVRPRKVLVYGNDNYNKVPQDAVVRDSAKLDALARMEALENGVLQVEAR